MFILRRRWQSSLVGQSILEGMPLLNYQKHIKSILSGEKGWILNNLTSERSRLINANRYDLLLYLLSRHLDFLRDNDLVKEVGSLNQLEIVRFMHSLDFKQISNTLDNDVKKNLAKSLLLDLSKLGDYNLLVKYIDGFSHKVSRYHQTIAKLACISISKEAFDNNDPLKMLDGQFSPREVSTILKCYATHAPAKYHQVSLYLKARYPLQFTIDVKLITQQITFYLKQKRMGKVKQLISFLFEKKLPIDDTLILCVVSGLFSNGLVTEAVAFFTQAKKLGFDPGTKAYSAMIIGCINNEMQMTAFSYFNDFKLYLSQKGENEIPTLRLYRVAMVMFLKLKDIPSAEMCFQELRNSKILKPNSFMYSIMMYAYMIDRQPDKVKNLYREMVKEGVVIIDNCSKLYAMAQGKESFRKWYKQFLLDTKELLASKKITQKQRDFLKSTFSSIFEYILSYSRDYELGKRLRIDMQELGMFLTPFIGYIFRIACVSFDHYYVNKLLGTFRNEKLEFDHHALLGYIVYLSKMHRYVDCQAVLDKYHETNTPTSISIYHSLKCNFFKKTKFKETLEKFRDYPWDGRVYALVIHFYGREKDFETCITYWNEFLRKDKITRINGLQISPQYHYTRDICIREMLWTCVWHEKYEMLKNIWLETVIELGLDRRSFKQFSKYLVPVGDGKKKLVEIG